ncbi:sulfide/dihydroorotate dehydrogenase-like FAD/NAD-binding protein [candidate division KSB1 bacterium]|nr:sulfide/dihydroorotate dehydrogenase-like FAD/NAD-binding protein [candidate division KSB1 bacterium]
MNEILRKRVLAEGVVEFDIDAPLVARKRKAGQFIVLRINEQGERIPLTIADAWPRKGIIRIVFQVVGKTTEHLATLGEGDSLQDVVGPLGKPTHIERFGTVVCIGGGIGIAPIYPIAKALKGARNGVISIIGARTKELLIMEKEMARTSHQLLISTDDGSYGHHGFVTDVLKNLIDSGTSIDQVFAVGPVIMMKMICKLTRTHDLPTIVSLNPIMVDATGMCGACRVEVGGETKFACVDGPEFDGHRVNFDGLIKRQRMYLDQEKVSWEAYHKGKQEEHSRLGE